MTAMDSTDDVLVARIGKPHGLRGEVTVQVHTDLPQERFVVGAVFATEPDRGSLTVRSARVHNGIQLLAFDEAADRTAAEALRAPAIMKPVLPPMSALVAPTITGTRANRPSA